MFITRVTLASSALIALTAGAALLSGCGSDCAQTLTCGAPGGDGAQGGGGSAPSGTGGTTNTGGTTSTGGTGGDPGTGGMGGDPGTGGMGGAPPLQPIAIGMGRTHSCAVLPDGTAKCWGENTEGKLGNGSTADSSTPVSVAGLANLISIAGGRDHTCALKNDGTVWCWGGNGEGQLGNGTLLPSFEPVQVVGINAATQIAVVAHTSCARLSDASVTCWGENASGALGNNSTMASSVPVTAQQTSVAAIALGGDLAYDSIFACARLNSGTVRCWGEGDYGELGDGSDQDSLIPVTVSGVGDAVDLSSGPGYNQAYRTHSCAARATGDVVCWGYNGKGQLGDGSSGGHVSTPVTVVALSGATKVAAATNHSCAVLNDGTVRCWGTNLSGTLGNGTNVDSPTPVQVSGVTGATGIAAGAFHTCTVTGSNAVLCWGANDYGQLGNGNTTDSNVPVMVQGL